MGFSEDTCEVIPFRYENKLLNLSLKQKNINNCLVSIFNAVPIIEIIQNTFQSIINIDPEFKEYIIINNQMFIKSVIQNDFVKYTFSLNDKNNNFFLYLPLKSNIFISNSIKKFKLNILNLDCTKTFINFDFSLSKYFILKILSDFCNKLVFNKSNFELNLNNIEFIPKYNKVFQNNINIEDISLEEMKMLWYSGSFIYDKSRLNFYTGFSNKFAYEMNQKIKSYNQFEIIDNKNKFLKFSFEFNIIATRIILAQYELVTLQSDDIIVTSTEDNNEYIITNGLNSDLCSVKYDKNLVITNIFKSLLDDNEKHGESFKMDKSYNDNTSDLNEIDEGSLNNTPVKIDIELGSISIPLNELLTLSKGMILDMKSEFSSNVILKADNKIVATGELLEIKNQMAVRIKTVLD